MNKILAYILCLLFTMPLKAQKHYCIFDDLLPAYELTDAQKAKAELSTKSQQTIYLRTVVHVLHKQPNQLISQTRIENLIEDCNELLSAQSVDLSQVHPQHHSAITDTKIQLCLAHDDPQGQSSQGITYTAIDSAYFPSPDVNDPLRIEMVKQDTFGGVSAWDTTRYFNIWIAPMNSDSVWTNYGMPYAGFTFTGDILPGWIPGAVVDMSMMTAPEPLPVNIPSVVTHEIAHVLGLLHTWGDDIGQSSLPTCDLDDGIADTPTCALAVHCLPALNANTCTDAAEDKVDNVANVMNYGCAIMFTAQQANLMYSNVVNAPLDIVTDQNCEVSLTALDELDKTSSPLFKLYPNPNKGVFSVNIMTNQKAKQFILSNSIGEVLSIRTIAEQQKKMQYELGNIKAGVYFLRLETDRNAYTEKIIISN